MVTTRHVWPSSKDGGRPAAEAMEVLQEQVEELGARIARLEQTARQSRRAGACELEHELVQCKV